MSSNEKTEQGLAYLLGADAETGKPMLGTDEKPKPEKKKRKQTAYDVKRGKAARNGRRRAHSYRTAREANTPKTYVEALERLGQEERDFVREYLLQPNGTKAYLQVFPDASPEHARKQVNKMRHRWAVQDALRLGRRDVARKLAKATEHSMQAAFDELGEAMDFARDTGNATALARLIELRARLCGLLIDRAQVQTSGFQLVINEKLVSEQPLAIEGEQVREALPADLPHIEVKEKQQ